MMADGQLRISPKSYMVHHTQRLSLRFAAGSHSMDGQDIATDTGTRRLLGLANDTLAEFRKRVPNTVNWTNRGPIGAFYFDNCGARCNCNTTLPAARIVCTCQSSCLMPTVIESLLSFLSLLLTETIPLKTTLPGSR